MRRLARALAPIALTLTLIAHPAVAQTAAEKANALFEAEDWAAAAKAYEALLAGDRRSGDPAGAGGCPRRRRPFPLRSSPSKPSTGSSRAVDLGLPVGFMDSLPALAEIREDSRFAELRQVAERKSFPCKHQPRYRDFDFWIGRLGGLRPGRRQGRHQHHRGARFGGLHTVRKLAQRIRQRRPQHQLRRPRHRSVGPGLDGQPTAR